MTKGIRGVYLDAHNARAKRAYARDSLDNWYTLLDCNTIDIVSRTIGGRRFAIVCDDEGLLKEECRISAVDENFEPMLVGSLFVCADAHNGELESLAEEDIAHVLKCVRKIPTRRYPDGLCMFTRVSY